jgi:hypothetical protein
MSAEQSPIDERITGKATKARLLLHWLLSSRKRSGESEAGILLPLEHDLPILQEALSEEEPGLGDSALPASTDFKTFWRTFRFLPWSIDEFTISKGYLFSIVFYFALLILDLIGDLTKYGSLAAIKAHFSTTLLHREIAHYWLFLLSVIWIAIIMRVFNRWKMSLSGTFELLFNKGHIISLHKSGNLQNEYFAFLRAYEKDLLSKWRHLYLVFVLLLGLAITWSSTHSAIAKLQMLDIPGGLYILIGTTFAFLVTGYALVICSWLVYATGKRLKRLPYEFKLNIQASHPDNCGGLSVIGDLTFGMVLPMLLLILLMGLATLLLFTPVSKDIYEPLLSAILLPFVLILLYIAFFVPLSSIHSEMVKRKRSYEDDFARWSTKLELTIHSSIVELQESKNDQVLNTARTAKEELEILQTIDPNKINYPTWPFKSRVLIAFLIPQIPTILGWLAALKGPLLDLVKILLQSPAK